MRIQALDKRTGELIDLSKYEIVVDDLSDQDIDKDIRLSIPKKRTKVASDKVSFSGNAFRAYVPEEDKDDEKEIILTSDFGELRPLIEKNGHKFTKVFQTSKPTFSKRIYGAYWLDIIHCLERDTGVICQRHADGKISRLHTLADWQKFLDCTKPTVSGFLKECLTKRYIHREKLCKKMYYFVNPTYAWNGNLIPKCIHEVFFKGESNEKTTTA